MNIKFDFSKKQLLLLHDMFSAHNFWYDVLNVAERGFITRVMNNPGAGYGTVGKIRLNQIRSKWIEYRYKQ